MMDDAFYHPDGTSRSLAETCQILNARAARQASVRPADLLEKLELMANLQPGDSIPPEVGPSENWGLAVSKLFAEALGEIKSLRAKLGALPQAQDAPQPPQPEEPWASTFVLDPNNWK